MKVLVLDMYRVFYYLTGSKMVSYICATLMLSAMYVILLIGFVTLIQDMLPKGIVGYLTLPADIGLGIIIALVIFFTTPVDFVATMAHNNQGRSLFRLLILALICLLLLTFNYMVKHF